MFKAFNCPSTFAGHFLKGRKSTQHTFRPRSLRQPCWIDFPQAHC